MMQPKFELGVKCYWKWWRYYYAITPVSWENRGGWISYFARGGAHNQKRYVIEDDLITVREMQERIKDGRVRFEVKNDIGVARFTELVVRDRYPSETDNQPRLWYVQPYRPAQNDGAIISG